MLEDDFESDTDDEDYKPEGDQKEAVSEEENSGDEEEAGVGEVQKGGKRRKNTIVPEKGKSRGGMFDDGDKVELGDWKEEINEEKKKQRVDDLWADFKKDTNSSVILKVTKPSRGLSNLFDCSSTEAVLKDVPSKSNRLSSLFDTRSSKNEEDSGLSNSNTKPKNSFSDLFDTPQSDKSNTSTDKPKDDKHIEITKVYDFAGEEVKISKKVAVDSSEATKFMSSGKRPAASSGGLAGLVGSFEKKKKMGCLDKSQMDWNKFVDENNIKEELTTHNKGKDGYVEKMQFLERSDIRQFEHEKAVRDKNRKSLMK